MHDHLLMFAKSKFDSTKALVSQALIDFFFIKKQINTGAFK